MIGSACAGKTMRQNKRSIIQRLLIGHILYGIIQAAGHFFKPWIIK